ncbi:MAG: metallophosphoesterase [Hyphomonadaceae bacterium]|nr:metallophosphoesterase [Hyphomonadaceae bacterium]
MTPDLLHPQMAPATIGAVIGLPVVIYACAWLFRRWNALSRRSRVIWIVLIALLEALYWLNIYAWFVEPNQLVVRHVEVVSEDWRGPPLTIAAISDTHVGGPHVDAARMGGIVQRINALRPELVVLLGDYVNGHLHPSERSPAENQEITGGVATFAAIRARYGVVGVIGNHDVWYDRTVVQSEMENAGVATLWNRHIVIRRTGGDPMVIAGIADFTTGDPDFAAALDGAPEGADTIVISHSPDPFAGMPRGVALMLAGHGHCGQVTIPFVGRPIVPLMNDRYACGLVQERGEQMYVTGGIGTSMIPVRFLNPPEIVLITLRGRDSPHP